jgi:hypothetical protein
VPDLSGRHSIRRGIADGRAWNAAKATVLPVKRRFAF